ncbi:MAG: single-stranded-DNA-specific exonuclease RecJ, partial [Okeania sp. SIO2H7]|nr:single-stranded-DNA-specific exonuclease RecJ [Okeania sp. SIO2H7]
MLIDITSMANYPISKRTRDRLPDQRWFVYPEQPQLVAQVAEITELSPLLAQVLINRNIETPAETKAFLDPESITLPSPMEEFPDLPKSIELLEAAIAQKQKIAICGDYDADGMTSTALLIRAFRHLGAIADYAIPSRMREGYGINERIVEEFHAEEVRLILTVDNGIAAHKPIARARELGIDV